MLCALPLAFASYKPTLRTSQRLNGSGRATYDSSGRLGMVGERCGRHLGLIWRAVAMLKWKSRVDKVEVGRRCCAGAEAWQWEPTNEVSRDFAGGQRHPTTLPCLFFN